MRRSDLTARRKARKLTQFRLGVLAGVPPSVICRLEQSGVKPQTQWVTVARLSRALDADPFELFPVEGL